MAVALRSAEPSDVDRIVEAYIASWRAGYAGLLSQRQVEEVSTRRRDRDWLSPIESSSTAVVVAAEGEAILGVVQADEELPEMERDLPEITMLYVVPTVWGTSVARDLLAAGSAWLSARGHAEARLRVVEKQARARRFYEREGSTLDPALPPAFNDFFGLIYYRRRISPAR